MMKTPWPNQTVDAVLALSCCVLLAGACANERSSHRDDTDPTSLAPPVQGPPAQQSAAEQNDEAQPQAQADKSLSPEAANRRMGSPGTTGNGTEQDSNTRANATGVRAAADLDAIGDAKLDGRVTFQEQTQGGVQLSVNVEDAKPGAFSVRVFDSDDCDGIEAGRLGKPLEASLQNGEVGSLDVGQDGKGSLATNAARASLKADDRASLLGKVIVVQERSTTGDVTGKPLACGVVELDKGLADKSGRASGTATRTP